MKTVWILALALAAGQSLAQQADRDAAGQQDSAAAEQSAPATAEETRIPVLIQRGLAAYQQKDYAAMEENLIGAVALRPYLAQLRYLLAKAYALQDKKREAYDSLVRLQSQGLSFDIASDEDFDNLRGFGLYDYLVEEFAKNAQPYGQATEAFTIDRTDLLVESLTYDPTRDSYLVGSVTNGTIHAIGSDGKLETIIEPDGDNGLLGVIDLEVDAERGLLWVISGASPHVAHARLTDQGKSYVHKFDLESGKQLARYQSPAPASYLLDLATAPDGSVYAADSVRPVVWKISPDQAAANENATMELFFAAGTLTGIRSVAVDDEGKSLYFTDYEFGLFGVDIAEKKPFMIHLGQNVNLSGIDDIHWFEDSLVLVQNGVSPRRIMRFQLFEDGRRGRHVQSMLSAHPEFRNPVAGTIHDGRFAVIANSHRNAYDPRTGKPVENADLKPHKVLEFPLDFGWMPPTATAEELAGQRKEG